jgi:hypothetical protein
MLLANSVKQPKQQNENDVSVIRVSQRAN